MSRAAVAVAHSILVSAYFMLLQDEPYSELGQTGWPAATTRPTPAAWSPNANASDTPSSSTRSHDSTAERQEDGLRPPRADARLQHPYSRVCSRGPLRLAYCGGAPRISDW
jgi:hypothetical protein